MSARYYTVEAYALRTGYSERWIYKLLKDGKLDAEKVPPAGSGNHYWLIREDVEESGLRVVEDA